ncbi:MAG TPA: hypothetical protein VIM69_02070 [Opitutaceae bacterium]
MKLLFSASLLALASPAFAQTQESLYRVYQYETPLAGWAEPAVWTTYIPRSDQPYTPFGGGFSRDGLWAHAAELEFGLTDYLSLASYAIFEDPSGGPFRYTQARVEARYRFAQAYELPVDLAVYAEYYFPRKTYSDEQELELRVILQKEVEDFRIVLNPVASFATSGEQSGESPDISLHAGVYYRRFSIAQPGFEIYSDFGQSGKWKQQRYVAMPVVDLNLGRHVIWELGVGRGFSGPTDRWIVKSILQFEFDAVRPSRWFRSFVGRLP